MQTRSVKLAAIVVAGFLTACGGGGSAGGTPGNSGPPVIAVPVQPASITVTSGTSVSFSVVASSTTPLSYQWQRNGVDVPGATSAQYTLAVTQASDTGSLWTVVVGNSGGKVVSTAVTLTVTSKTLVAGSMLNDGLHASGDTTLKGVAIDSDGTLYVSDVSSDKSLHVLSTQGVASLLPLRVTTGDTTAALSQAVSLARDSSGNFYATDQGCGIHKISASGLLSTLAGSSNCGATDGKGSSATFVPKLAITVDATGTVYVAGGGTIRKIMADGTTTTLAGIAYNYGNVDGNRDSARFGGVSGIAVDTTGNVYVADNDGNGSHIRKLTPAGVVSTLAGGSYGSSDGVGTTAHFSGLAGLSIDRQGNLVVVDAGNFKLRKITPGGMVTTLAGSSTQSQPQPVWFSGQVIDGMGTAATLSAPGALTTDTAGNLFLIDAGFVRKITPAGQVVTVSGSYAGAGVTDGPVADARFFKPRALAVQSDGTVLVADTGNGTVRRISNGVVSTVAGNPGTGLVRDAGDGTGVGANFVQPAAITVGSDGVAYVVDAARPTVRRVTPDGVVTTFAGNYQNLGNAADGQGKQAGFSSPLGIVIDINGVLFVTDNQAVRKIDKAGNVSTLTGLLSRAGTANGTAATDGTLANARFGFLSSIAIDALGNLYLTDTLNQNIRKITPAGIVSTLAGNTGVAGDADGQGGAATFSSPEGIAVDKAGNVYVADTGNNLIRRISPTGTVTTLAGKRGMAGNSLGAIDGVLDRPKGLAFDANGALLVTSANGIFKLQL